MKIAPDVTKMFDLLGWFASCTIVVKVLMQDLGRLKYGITQFLTVLYMHGRRGEKNFLSSPLIPYPVTTWSVGRKSEVFIFMATGDVSDSAYARVI